MAMSKDRNTAFPLQCVTLDPLHNTPIRLFIVDIIKLVPVLGSRGLFLYKSHVVNNVDVLGIVTSVKVKEDVIVCSLDDGTGSIQCYCSLTHLSATVAGSSPRTRITALKKRLCVTTANQTIKLGDFLHVRGCIKKGLWNDEVYISNCSWTVANGNDMDDVWLKLQCKQMQLYIEIYDKPFELDKKLQQASKSMLVTEIHTELLKCVEPVIYRFVHKALNTDVFFGYEVLEIDEIKAAISKCFSEQFDTDIQLSNSIPAITKHDRNLISSNVVSSVLHAHVVSGHLIKKKCLQHEVLVKNDQMDSRYYVTTHCTRFMESAHEALTCAENIKQSTDVYSVLHFFDDIEFNFIKSSKHGFAILSVAVEKMLHS